MTATRQPFTDTDTADAFTTVLTRDAVQSIRLRGGQWMHRRVGRTDFPASFPLGIGESVQVNGRWFHGPRIGARP